jgi:hypothetical protein|tara:strand:- start:2129 stop:2461 length:333 start_codon:yes stop_codon:yes gene_type:complete
MEDLGNAIGGLSAGGILLLLVIREFLSHMSKSKEAEKQASSSGDDDSKLQSIDDQMKQIATSTGAICMLVEKVDSSGLPLIYRDQRLPDAVDGLNKSIEKLGDRVEKLNA